MRDQGVLQTFLRVRFLSSLILDLGVSHCLMLLCLLAKGGGLWLWRIEGSVVAWPAQSALSLQEHKRGCARWNSLFLHIAGHYGRFVGRLGVRSHTKAFRGVMVPAEWVSAWWRVAAAAWSRLTEQNSGLQGVTMAEPDHVFRFQFGKAQWIIGQGDDMGWHPAWPDLLLTFS